jgi:hypothetical protein
MATNQGIFVSAMVFRIISSSAADRVERARCPSTLIDVVPPK